MTKNSKTFLKIGCPILIVLLILYFLVSAVYIPEPETIEYPTGELKNSIFVEQNNTYTANESLPKIHYFTTVPYAVDVTESNGASVGTGTVYQAKDTIFIYVSEYTDGYSIHDIITSQFPAAILISYVPENTRVVSQVDKTGYINGFSAEYICDTIYVSDGANTSQACVMGYDLKINDDYFSGNHLFISIATTDITNSTLEGCSQILSLIMGTVRKDEDLEEEMVAAIETKLAEQAAASAAASMQEEVAEEEAAEEESTSVVDSSEVTAIPVVLNTGYDNFNLTVEWTQSNTTAVCELFFPDGASYCEPVTQTAMGCSFALTSAEAGTYTLRILNYQDCGSISTYITGDAK